MSAPKRRRLEWEVLAFPVLVAVGLLLGAVFVYYEIRRQDSPTRMELEKRKAAELLNAPAPRGVQ